MNGVFVAAREVQAFFVERRWQFAIIGGLAVLRWGEPAATQDVDVALLTGFGPEREYVGPILERFEARVADAAEFALASRVVLVRASNGAAVDISLAGVPFEESMIARATDHEFAPHMLLRTCSAEDLVIMKAFAGRPKDWAAVEGVLARQEDRLDWHYIEEHLPPLCEAKGEPELVTRLWQMRRDTGKE